MRMQVLRKTDHVELGPIEAQIGMMTLDGEIVKVNAKSIWVKGQYGERKLDATCRPSVYLTEAKRFGWVKP